MFNITYPHYLPTKCPTSRLFSSQMYSISSSSGCRTGLLGDGPGLRIRLRVVDGNLQIHVAKIFASEAFGHLQRVRDRVSVGIEPGFAVRSGRLDNQRVAVPVADRISLPVGIRVFGEGPAIHEDLPEDGARLVEDDDEPRSLNDLPRRCHGIFFGNAGRQAEIVRIVLASGVHVLFVHFGRPGLERDFLQVRGDVDQVLKAGDQPDAAEVRLAIRQSRRFGREVDFTVLRSRCSGGRDFQPLRGDRYARPNQACECDSAPAGWFRQLRQ